MFDNIDEIIEVNLKLLYLSKSQFMMRINFKDKYGYNLKNTKAFAEILEDKGIVALEKDQGFRCDLTEFGKQIFENGGWMKYLETIESLTKFKNIVNLDSEVKKIEKSFMKHIVIGGTIILLLCFVISLVTIELFKMP